MQGWIDQIRRNGWYIPGIVGIILGLMLFRSWASSWATEQVELASAEIATTVPIEITPTTPILLEQTPEELTTNQAEFVDVPIPQNRSISPRMNPATYKAKAPQHGAFQTYEVQKDDVGVYIAEKFGIKPETLLGGNPRLSEESNLLRAGDELIILPVDGVLHDVSEGDTLEELASTYGAKLEDIVAYAPNNLEFPYRLIPDTQILVPNGIRQVFQWNPPKPVAVSRPPSSSSSSGTTYVPPSYGGFVGGFATGSFRWPTTSYRITQWYWYSHQAIDIGVPVGNSVYAADSGTITYAGWNPFGYGNLIVINHGNGAETLYAHLQSGGIFVSPGDTVYQGNVIGYTGNTGNSTGPHLHFEIRWNSVRNDPCAWLAGC